jgi:hypothetical protein
MSDIEKIEKLVRLTQSDNDHEALLALRNAQRLANGDLLSVLQGRAEEDEEDEEDEEEKESNRTARMNELERGRRFLELLQRIRMKDATIAEKDREIARLKAELNKPH